MPKLFETKLDKAGDVINKTPVLSHGLKFANKWSEHDANVLQKLREHNESTKFGRFMNKTDDILRAPEKFVSKVSSAALGKVSDLTNVDPRALMIAGALTPVGRKVASKAKPLVNKAANKAVLKILRSVPAQPVHAYGPKKPLSKAQWLSEAKEHYLSNYKKSSEPFKGYPRYTDESGTTWRATTGNKIKGIDK
tara:strand:+ start:388 stop:969 length:582 start_codon:yes stop_codon:yes gene_type:complete